MRPQIESLEGRNMMAVSLTGGTLIIQADLPSNNSAYIYVENEATVVVGLNGQVSRFNASGVHRVVYQGGQQGGDLFENSTNTIPSQVSLYGLGNTFVGGLGQDVLYLFGSRNHIDAGGGRDMIFTFGDEEFITPYSDQIVV